MGPSIGCAATLGGGGSEDIARSQPGVERISFDLRRKCESLIYYQLLVDVFTGK